MTKFYKTLDYNSLNRNPILKFFVTFPQCGGVTKLKFLTICQELKLKYYIICKELHQDGNPHLHIILWLAHKMSKPQLLKFFKSKFPNDNQRIQVAPVRSITHAIAYVKKEDAGYLEHPDGPPKKVYTYPKWMVVQSRNLLGYHPSEGAREYREIREKLEIRKKDIDKILTHLLLDYPYSKTQCDILEKERDMIVYSLLS